MKQANKTINYSSLRSIAFIDDNNHQERKNICIYERDTALLTHNLVHRGQCLNAIRKIER
jgi:hypothetical protein